MFAHTKVQLEQCHLIFEDAEKRKGDVKNLGLEKKSVKHKTHLAFRVFDGMIVA